MVVGVTKESPSVVFNNFHSGRRYSVSPKKKKIPFQSMHVVTCEL